MSIKVDDARGRCIDVSLVGCYFRWWRRVLRKKSKEKYHEALHKCYKEVCSEDWRWYGLSREVSVCSEKRRLMVMCAVGWRSISRFSQPLGDGNSTDSYSFT